MNILLKRSGGKNIVLRPQMRPRYYPAPTIEAASVLVGWHYADQSPSETQELGIFPLGAKITLPLTRDQDKDVVFRSISISPSGTRSVSTWADALATTVPVQRETEAPVIGQVSPATPEEASLKIVIGITGFTRYARKRRVRIADNEDMTDAIERILDTTDYAARELPRFYDLERATGSPGVASSAQIEFINPLAGVETINIGGKTYTFVDGDNTGDSVDVSSGTNAGIAANLVAKINADTATTLCDGTHSVFSPIITLTANTPGVAGDSITLTTDTRDIDLTTFDGGEDSEALLPQTVYVTVAHSSGTEWTPDSEVLVAIFADGAGDGGSEGGFDPIPRDRTTV